MAINTRKGASRFGLDVKDLVRSGAQEERIAQLKDIRRKGRPPRVSDERLRELHARGLTDGAIAIESEMAKSGVSMRLRKMDLEPNTVERPKAKRERELKGKRSFAHAIALMDPKYRGLSIDQTVIELQRRYHPEETIEVVHAAYFPRSGCNSISRLEGKSHGELLDRLRNIRAFWQRQSERERKRHRDPDFAAKFSRIASQMVKKLHANPVFAAEHSERMRKNMQDLGFIQKISEGQRKFWYGTARREKA